MSTTEPRTLETPKKFLEHLLSAIGQPSDRVVLTALFGLIFGLHYGSRLFMVGAGEPIFPGFRTAEIMGFVAIFFVLQKLGTDTVLQRLDPAIIVVAAIVLIHPWPGIGGLVLTGLGLSLVTRQDRRLASLGQLCLGLAWIDLWGVIALNFVAAWLLPLETALSFLAVSPFGTFSLVGNAILGENGHGVVVAGACSAFANTITTTFIWLSLVKIQGLAFHPWHVRVLAVSLVAVVLLNTARLAMMAHSYPQYLFWHDGAGATYLSISMLVIIFGLFCFGLRRKSSV